MAENNLIVAPGLGFVLGSIEATSGTAETLDITEALYVSEVSWSYDREPLARNPMSPERPGVLSAMGAASVSYSMQAEFSAPTISDSGDVPHNDVLLRSGGFQSTFDDASDAFVYVLTSSDHKSASFEINEFEALGTKSNRTLIRGARHGWTIDINAGEIALLSCNGAGLAASTLSTTYAGQTPASKAAEYYSSKPFVADSGHVEIVNLSTDAVYGTGTPGSPGNKYQVLSLSLDSGWTIEQQRGLSATGSTARVRLGGAAPVTGSIVFETVQLNSSDGPFDPYALRDDLTPLEIRVKFTHNTSDHLCFNLYAQIVSVDRTEDSGRSLWTCGLELKYCEDSDGAPSVGTAPEQVFKYSDGNRGLFADVTLTTPGLLAITYYSG